MPVEMDVASEYRYRDPIVGPGDLVIGISQSGETADTLAAMRLARERGATVLAVTNVMGSQATRDADGVLFTRAGPRGRRRGDQDVRLPGRRDVPARAAPRRARGHDGGDPPDRAGRRDQAAPAPHRRAAGERADAAVERIAERPPRGGLLPLPRPPRRPAGRPRGRAQAQGDLLHRDGRLRGRRDEARPDRAARRGTRRSSSWRRTRPCWRRSSPTCRRSAPAAPT